MLSVYRCWPLFAVVFDLLVVLPFRVSRKPEELLVCFCFFLFHCAVRCCSFCVNCVVLFFSHHLLVLCLVSMSCCDVELKETQNWVHRLKETQNWVHRLKETQNWVHRLKETQKCLTLHCNGIDVIVSFVACINAVMNCHSSIDGVMHYHSLRPCCHVRSFLVLVPSCTDILY